ncbi:MAG: hypothetical protein U9N19_03755 [Thermodesulfobacteriota bacterium]|nr:hypothetical protein [Thermodesulfobacteriota bacterium]
MVKGQTSRKERGVHELCIYSESERRSSVQARCGKTVLKQLPGHGPVILMKRPVRTRMQGVVGRVEKPALTRLRPALASSITIKCPLSKGDPVASAAFKLTVPR